MINSHNNIKPDPPLLNPTTIIAADSENPTKSKRIVQLTGEKLEMDHTEHGISNVRYLK